MTTPKFLYRGTPRKNVKEFVSKERLGSQLIITASSKRKVAVKFIVPIENRPIWTGCINEIEYYICADEKKFREMDKGGAIYKLPSDNFKPVPRISNTIYVNSYPVKPLSKEVVSSALEAMIKEGVQVYFVTPEINEKLKSNKEKRAEILRGLVPENIKEE